MAKILVYNTDEPITEAVLEHSHTKYFLNLFFTASPELAEMIRKKGGILLSTITSFHEAIFQKAYRGFPFVMCDFRSGIGKAFDFYKRRGKNSFAFFAQGNMGKHNYAVFADEAKKRGISLQEKHFPLADQSEGSLFSGRRRDFFMRAMKKLPEGTVVFSDGLFHIAEMFRGFLETGKGERLSGYDFCITGEPYRQTMSELPSCRIGWIPACSSEVAQRAAETLLSHFQDKTPIPESQMIETNFEPDVEKNLILNPLSDGS